MKRLLWGLCVLVIVGCSVREPLPDPADLTLRTVPSEPEEALDPLYVLSAQVAAESTVEGGAALDVVLPQSGPSQSVQLLLWEVAPTATSSLSTLDGQRTLRVTDPLAFPSLRLKVVVRLGDGAAPLNAGTLSDADWLRLAGAAPRATSDAGPVSVGLSGTIAIHD